MNTFWNLALLTAILLFPGHLSAADLYNINFDPGTYESILGPLNVQPSVGPLNNALVMNAAGSEQIGLTIGIQAPGFHIQYDVFAHNLLNSHYGFGIILDTPEVRRVDFHGDLQTVEVYQPSPYTIADVLSFSNDQLYHVDIFVNLQSNRWSVAVDGVQKYSNLFNASDLQSIRFSLAPTRGLISESPGTYVGLDNIVVTIIPEPSSLALTFNGLLVSMLCYRRLSKPNVPNK